jgi:rfaE bifunctional protein kinase chain/domain
VNQNLDFLDSVSVLVVGDIMLDRYLWGDTRRISPEAPVPVVEIERETHTLGGAANVANNLAALGVRCELFGMIGRDNAGIELQAMLQQRGINFDTRLARDETATITKTRIVAQRQQLCRLDKESEPEAYSIVAAGYMSLLSERAAAHDAIIVSDYAKGVVCQQTLDCLREARARRKAFIALDPKPHRPLEIAELDLITPNLNEALQLADIPASSRHRLTAEDLAAELQRRYRPAHLVITMGERGMLLLSRSGAIRSFPSVVRQVADVSGAGDTVISTLAASLAAGQDPAVAVQIANAAAGVVVAKLGTATLTREELHQALLHSTPT